MRIVHEIKLPQPGKVRFKRSFAWLPTYAGGSLIWLETYEKMYAWVVTQYIVLIKDKPTSVAHGEWKCISTRLMKK